MTDLSSVKYVYWSAPDESGEHLERHLVGKVLEDSGHLYVLCDYYGYLGFREGPMDERTQRAWAALIRNPYFEVVPASDVHSGHRPDLVREGDVPTAAEPDGEDQVAAVTSRRPSTFLYTHQLLAQPVEVSVRGGEFLFNGHTLSPGEVVRVLENLRSGSAKLRYRQSVADGAIAKMEARLAQLEKVEPHLEGALGALRAAVKSGKVDESVLRALTREIFGDHMVAGVGNKVAYRDFLSRPRGGVHVALDGNSFKHVNDVHGHEVGDQAIRAMGEAVRRAADRIGKSRTKVFRTGGDEFRVHVETPEHAALFARHLRSELEAVPPVGGTHQLSMSVGIGPTPEAADRASYEAKKAVKASGRSKGQECTHAYSAMPGAEGHVPLAPEHPAGLTPPPPGARSATQPKPEAS